MTAVLPKHLKGRIGKNAGKRNHDGQWPGTILFCGNVAWRKKIRSLLAFLSEK